MTDSEQTPPLFATRRTRGRVRRSIDAELAALDPPAAADTVAEVRTLADLIDHTTAVALDSGNSWQAKPVIELVGQLRSIMAEVRGVGDDLGALMAALTGEDETAEA